MALFSPNSITGIYATFKQVSANYYTYGDQPFFELERVNNDYWRLKYSNDNNFNGTRWEIRATPQNETEWYQMQHRWAAIISRYALPPKTSLLSNFQGD